MKHELTMNTWRAIHKDGLCVVARVAPSDDTGERSVQFLVTNAYSVRKEYPILASNSETSVSITEKQLSKMTVPKLTEYCEKNGIRKGISEDYVNFIFLRFGKKMITLIRCR